MYKKLGAVLLACTFSFTLLPATVALATETSDTVQNPFIWADVPDNDVIRVGDAYYMTSTTMHMNPGVPIMKSYDLVNWEIVNYVYDVLDGEDDQTLSNGENEYGKGSWASSLRYNDGTYYIAFSSNSTGKTYIYQTEDIENGPWRCSTIDRLFHDMSLLFDDDGRVYMAAGAGDIHITELTSDATAIKEGGLDKTIIQDASLIASPNVGLAAEGAHIQKINGKYYVFLITWPKDGGRQELCFRADSIDGDYEGKVVLNYKGIAQGGIVDTPNGDWYGMLFKDSGPVGRMPYLIPVTWEDGWPVFGVDGKVPDDTGIKLDLSKTNIVSSDEFYQGSEKIGYSHTVLETSYDEEDSEGGGNLVLDNPEDGKELLKNGDFDDGTDYWEVNESGNLSAATTTGASAVLKISERGGTGGGPKQNITGKLEKGKTYYFSAKVKYDESDFAPEQRQFNFTMQNGPDYRYRDALGSKIIKKGEWGTIKGTYTMSEDVDPDNIFIFIETSWTSQQDPDKDLMDFYVDDVSFVDMTADPNIIKNGQFDSDLESWTNTWASNVKWNNDGTAHVYERTNTGGGIKHELSGKVKAGEKYKFSAKVKYDDGPDSKYFNYTLHTKGDIKIMGSANITKGEWGVIEGTYTIDGNADTSADTYIFLETPWTANPDVTNDLMDFYVDDVSLELVSTEDSGIKDGENDYNGSNLGLVWQWNHNPDNNNWSLTDRDGYLRLITGRKSTSILDARNTLTQRTFGPQCSGNVAIDVSNMKNGDYAGLAAFQFYYGTVGVKMEGDSKYIVMMRGSTNDASKESEPVEIARIPLDQENVYLKIDFNYENNTNKAYFYYSLDGNEWNKIGEDLSLVYTLPHFMGYRFGLFNYATKTTGGYVDFDYFRLDGEMIGEVTSNDTLNAELGNVSNVLGFPNVDFEVPIALDELPDGNYTNISASFGIPKDLSVADVVFNTDNVTGECSYTYSNNQLKLNVSGNEVNYKNNTSNRLFATIKLKVAKYVESDRTETITTDYINVKGGNTGYNIKNSVSNISLKALSTDAIAKIPGYGNPLITHKLGADPYAIVYDGRVYVYLSSDEYMYDDKGNIKENTFSNLNRVLVISSDDMINWTDHGYIPVAGKDGIAKWASGSWAPAATHKVINGKDKFFLYFANGGGGIGVLTADSPIGPWTDPIGKALISPSTDGVGNGVVWLFDPAVLVDDDGEGYLYFGGGIPGGNNPTDEQIANPKTARVIKLGDNMTSIEGAAKEIDSPYMFEDSGIHKHNGTYYYTYCLNFAGTHPNNMPAGQIAYMTSDSPMGPFTYGGAFLKNPAEYFGYGGNNHHTVFEYNGKEYIVYHAQTVSGELLSSTKGYRSPHISEVNYYDSGKIKVVNADMKGVPQTANLNPYTRNEAEAIAWNAGISTENCTAPGSQVKSINLNVTDINNGDWIAVANANFGSVPKEATTTFKANVASSVGGQIKIHLDSLEGKVIGTLEVNSTGGEQNWKEIECKVENVNEVHSIFFEFVGQESSNLFNIDYWEFETETPNQQSCTFTYTAGEGGLIQGNTSQTVDYGKIGSKVTAIANSGYHFVRWSDGVTNAERTDTNLGADINVNAVFEADSSSGNNGNPGEEAAPVGVKIDGTKKVGNTLSTQLINKNGSAVSTSEIVSYEWYRSDSTNFDNAELIGTDPNYKLLSKDGGKYIKLKVTVGGNTFECITSKISKKSSSSSGSSNKKETDTNATDTNLKPQQETTVVGWKQVNGIWYYLNVDGTTVTGWKQVNGIWYYLNTDGAMATGWKQVNGTWYHLNADGAMATGWKQVNGTWYYLNSNGSMATGWIQVNGKWYYLNADGAMASNTVIDGYTVDESGAWI